MNSLYKQTINSKVFFFWLEEDCILRNMGEGNPVFILDKWVDNSDFRAVPALLESREKWEDYLKDCDIKELVNIQAKARTILDLSTKEWKEKKFPHIFKKSFIEEIQDKSLIIIRWFNLYMIRCSKCKNKSESIDDQKAHLTQAPNHLEIETKAGIIDYLARQDQRMTEIEEKLKQT